MRNFYLNPVYISLFVILLFGTSICNADPDPKMTFTGFVVTKFESLQTSDGEENIDLPSHRDVELLETVFGQICKDCSVYGTGGKKDANRVVPTCDSVKAKLKSKANYSKNLDTAVVLLSTHAFVDTSGELHFLFQDSKVTIDENEKITSAVNTMSTSELAKIIVQFQCERMVLILDCCFSGNTGLLTQLEEKINAEKDRGLGSLAILCSSGGKQTSQVFVKRGVSLYTGFLLAALSGMGDRNQDGKVSVQEMHTYSYSLVGMISEMQEREMFTLDSYGTQRKSTPNGDSTENISIQRPELKTIVKGPEADIVFNVPNLPYEVTMEFLLQNIKDLIQLHNLDPKKIRVDDFVQKNFSMNNQQNHVFGRQLADKIRASINPKVTFTKTITDRKKKKKPENYLYAIQGEYQSLTKGQIEGVYLSVNFKIINLATNKPLEMFSLVTPPELRNVANENEPVPVEAISTVVNDMAEVAPSVLPDSDTHKYAEVTLKRRVNGKMEPLPAYPGGKANDYTVQKGDSLIVNVKNLTKEPIAVFCFVDGLNVILRDDEKDAERVNTMKNHIEKVRYFIIPPNETCYFPGWTRIRKGDDGKSRLLYNHFIVQDAPESLRSRLQIDPTQVAAPLGDIRVLIYEAKEMPSHRGPGIGVGCETNTIEGKKSNYRIPRAAVEPEEMSVLHYAFAPQNEEK